MEKNPSFKIGRIFAKKKILKGSRHFLLLKKNLLLWNFTHYFFWNKKIINLAVMWKTFFFGKKSIFNFKTKMEITEGRRHFFWNHEWSEVPRKAAGEWVQKACTPSYDPPSLPPRAKPGVDNNVPVKVYLTAPKFKIASMNN